MKIGLSYDLKEAFSGVQEGPEDALEEYDSVETVEALKRAIEARGHTVVKLGGGRQFLNNILTEKVDFVFNISEGLGSYRSREAQVPSVLEMLNIPYSGADPQCLAVCLDKHLTKKIVSLAGIPTPKWGVVDRTNLKEVDWNCVPYPAFVKPVYEGSSKGIRLKSLVRDPEQLKALVTELLETYQQPVLVEEFISGEEITVGMLGNNPPKTIGIMRVVPRKKEADFVYSLEVKRDYEKLVDYECPAQLPARTTRLIEEYSQRAFKLLDCRDFARLDYRVAPDGIPYFLEVNPLAGLNPRSSDIVIMSGLVNFKYPDLIGSILDAALFEKLAVKLKVALVYNQPESDRYQAMGESAAELGVLDEVKAVSQALTDLKYDCLPVPLRPPLSAVRRTLKSLKVDVVFNLFEGFDGSPETEAAVAALLTEFKLPFSGCPPQALSLALDKSKTKKLLKAAGIPTPDFQVLSTANIEKFGLNFPCIVKPMADDASHGLSEESVVYDLKGLEKQLHKICQLFGGQALVEEFVDGREFNTTVIGCKRLIIPAISEIVYSLPPDKPRLLTFESKWQVDSLYYKNTRNVCPAPITVQEKTRLSRIARAAYRLIGCKGYARVDFRQNQKGEFLVLEINPNPDITPGAGASLQIGAAGLSYTRFIQKIIRIALG